MSDPRTPSEANEHSILVALAASLGVSIVLFDREDRLLFASDEFRNFIPLPEEALQPGVRLRDFLSASYDCGTRFGKQSDGKREVSRDDWIADRIAVHWRERYESTEQLNDGRWVKMGKRRMPGGMLITYIVDVTDQKRRDRDFVEMRDHAELAQHILDKLPNPVIVKNSDLRFVLVNNAFCELLGIPAHEIIGMCAAELVGPVAGAKFEESERRVLKTGTPIEFVEDIPNSDGTISRVITRKHRSGTPGSYYVTISVDRILTYTADKNAIAAEGQRNARPKESKRVLVVDEITARAKQRVAHLTSAGVDALFVADQHQLIAFLETAKSMDISIDEIDASPVACIALSANPLVRNYPVLAQYVDKLRLDETAGAFDVGQPDDLLCDGGATSDLVVAVDDEVAKQIQVHEERVTRTQEVTDDHASPAEPKLSLLKSGVETPQVKSIQNYGLRKSGQTTAPTSRRTLVLVAEDNEVNQIVFQQILESISVDYHLVGNGEEAVAAWRELSPDLILMDVSMPVMNGHQATRAIRSEENKDGPASSHVPIIAVTAHALAGDSDECFAAGMDDYLTKPISPEKLTTTISNWVSTIGEMNKFA